MAAASDKARFYLEQQVPELQEYSRKKIFSPSEINSIHRRRSDCEHKLFSRGGSSPQDYARYAEYEMNLDFLRRKRVKRLGVKAVQHTGQRRIFNILDRGTKKFHGDVGLWMQYLTYARKVRANKKISQILTKVLRLHPTKSELWILAAEYVLEEKGYMSVARGFLQRGARFCGGRDGGRIWVEYARMEMLWIGKVVGRRRILGLDREKVEGEQQGTEGIEGDMVVLPKLMAEDLEPDLKTDGGLDTEALKRLEISPALSGAIPIAIFDAAVKQFKHDENLCLQFFDMVAGSEDLPCTAKILDAIMEELQKAACESPEVLIRFIRSPVMGLNTTTSGFPTQFGISLDRMKKSFEQIVPIQGKPETAHSRAILDGYLIEWLLSYLDDKDLDKDIRKVVTMTLKRIWKQYREDHMLLPDGRAAATASLIVKLRDYGFEQLADSAQVWAQEIWP